MITGILLVNMCKTIIMKSFFFVIPLVLISVLIVNIKKQNILMSASKVLIEEPFLEDRLIMENWMLEPFEIQK